MKMNTLAQLVRVLLGVAGVALVLLGIAFWTGHASSLIPVHAAIGLLFVVCLWVLSILGLKAGVNRRLVAFVFIWSLAVPIVGAIQMLLLPGAWHWVVQVTHLLTGIAAMYLGALLHRRISLAIS